MKKDKKRISRLKIGLYASLFALGAVVVLFYFRKETAVTGEFLAPVITIRPVRGNLEKEIRISSQIETGQLVTLASRVGGALTRLSVKPGQEVKNGESLAQVDQAPYELTLLQARTAFLTAESTYKRVSALYQAQSATRQNFEEARTAYEAAKAQYELAQLNLDYTRIRSPLDGVVLMSHGVEGGLVGAGSPVITLGDLSDLRIKAAVPEIHYRFFAENWQTMTVRMNVPALASENFTLSPLSLAPYISPENRSFLVEYSIKDGAQQGLRPGMYVNAAFVLESRSNVFYLPFKALASGGRLWYVDEDGCARYIEFTPEFYNDDFFQIPQEYGNREYILEGQHFITAGQKVKRLNEPQLAKNE
jgi:RND family efflux transporter MFP subunit